MTKEELIDKLNNLPDGTVIVCRDCCCPDVGIRSASINYFPESNSAIIEDSEMSMAEDSAYIGYDPMYVGYGSGGL